MAPSLLTIDGGINKLDCNDGRSLLHLVASAMDSPALVKRLIGVKFKANMQLQDAKGMTPLCVAAEAGNAGAVGALKECGDMYLQDAKGITPLCVAAEAGNAGAVGALKECGGVSRAYFLALKHGHREIARTLAPDNKWRESLDALGPLAEIYHAVNGNNNSEDEKTAPDCSSSRARVTRTEHLNEW